MMFNYRICYIFIFLFITLACVGGESDHKSDESDVPTIDENLLREHLRNQSKIFERELKNMIKSTVRQFLPTLVKYSGYSTLSAKCTSSIMKYISGLTSTKAWAMKMFDAMSKPPAGILEGTLSDFGAFDQCLDIELPSRKGGIEFRGQYCALEATPYMPPRPNNFSMAHEIESGPMDSIGEYTLKKGAAFYYLKLRLGICVPSSCTLEEMRALVVKISQSAKMTIEIPHCYTKKGVELSGVHIAVICCLAVLFVICASGSVLEYTMQEAKDMGKKLSKWREVLICFSFISNYKRLISPSGGAKELRALHGIRALSMAWVIFGHTYVWTNFQLLRRPERVPSIFRSFHFGLVLNSWLSVEPFFLLSGLLTCYAVLKLLPRTGGRINIFIYVFRRYLRLTPALLLVIGLMFFLPLISSGPFWYEVIDRELDSCTNNWWKSILYISNWTGMRQICIHPTWYLSADFQLYVVSIVVFYALYRSPKLGLFFIVLVIIVCNATIGAVTYSRRLPPIILITSGNDEQITETVDAVHMLTFTHAGAYYVGVVLGFLLVKYEHIKIRKEILICGWSLSFFLAVTSIYGAHKWNIGEPHGLLLTSVYASLHRTAFVMGVAWVAFACVTGHGGIVNECLSSSMLAPAARLTYMVYLLHSLVIWLRKASARERMYVNQYNILYEYIGNLAFTVVLAIPLYLLLEAPLLNLERMLFSRLQKNQKKQAEGISHLPENLMIVLKQEVKSQELLNTPSSVVLTSVTNLHSTNKPSISVITASKE